MTQVNQLVNARKRLSLFFVENLGKRVRTCVRVCVCVCIFFFSQITVPDGCCPGCGSKFQSEDEKKPGYLQADKLNALLGLGVDGEKEGGADWVRLFFLPHLPKTSRTGHEL
ncbi:MAG: hypothetical protein ABJQ38_09295 [Flavobacteriaceae bacterium]